MKSKTAPKSVEVTDREAISMDEEYENNKSLTLLELHLAIDDPLETNEEFCALPEEDLLAKCLETDVYLTARYSFFLETA